MKIIPVFDREFIQNIAGKLRQCNRNLIYFFYIITELGNLVQEFQSDTLPMSLS